MSVLTLTSPEFTAGAILDSSFQADRDNQSPALIWSAPPPGTRSFAVAMHDPDAPTGGAGWWHWLLTDLPPATLSLPRNAGAADGSHLPAGARQWRNDGGQKGYMGCYPPEGDPAHRYIYTVYALDCDRLDVAAEATTSMVGFVLNQHVLGKASLMAYYAR